VLALCEGICLFDVLQTEVQIVAGAGCCVC
jgi:hypothetical protein